MSRMKNMKKGRSAVRVMPGSGTLVQRPTT
jgi:hypothetical protein